MEIVSIVAEKNAGKKIVDCQTLEKSLNKLFGTPLGVIILALNGSRSINCGSAKTFDQIKNLVTVNGMITNGNSIQSELEGLVREGLVREDIAPWTGTHRYYLSFYGKGLAIRLDNISRILGFPT